MPYPLNLRLPDDLYARLDILRAKLTKRAGGVEMDFSKVVRHVLVKGLEVIEKELSTEGEVTDG